MQFYIVDPPANEPSIKEVTFDQNEDSIKILQCEIPAARPPTEPLWQRASANTFEWTNLTDNSEFHVTHNNSQVSRTFSKFLDFSFCAL